LRYRLRFHFADGASWEHADPYRFLPTLGDVDLHLFGEGTHRRLWEKLGARQIEIDGEIGVAFAVWAPNAERVSVVGDFCRWDGRLFPMRSLGTSGVFELFVPGLGTETFYKFEIVTRDGALRLRPTASALDGAPAGVGGARRRSTCRWNDAEWRARRRQHDPPAHADVDLGATSARGGAYPRRVTVV
jgi:1,4-alpha-glucan branching enzyme